MCIQKYSELSIIEKRKKIGMLVHAYQNDPYFYEIADQLIELSKAKGIFEGVTILPEPVGEINTETNY